MKYVVDVGGKEVAVEVLGRGSATRVLVDGEEMDATFSPIAGRAGWTLRLGERTHSVVIGARNGDSIVTVGSREFDVVVEDERERAAHAVRGAGASGPRVVRSVMPGIVREVHVAEGDTVEDRGSLLVLEAMKMQNEIRADHGGTVTKVHVGPDTAVAKGDPLLTLE